MRGYLIFKFHAEGCTVVLHEERRPQQVLATLSALDLLRLGLEMNQLFACMEHGTESYFLLKDEGTGVPPAFYRAFEEGGTA